MKLMRYISALLAVFTFVFSSPAQEVPTGKKGKLAGKVVDKKTSEEIIGATVMIEGSSIGTQTDIDGKFFLQLDPGTYNIVVSYVSYKTRKFEGVEITQGQLTNLSVLLEESSQELEEVVVKGEVKKESAAGLVLQQKNMVAVSSGVSAELIRKLPDRTTADVIKRVSGATIQDGKFAIIRGMQDRYNYGLINGAPLPSSEPDRKAFSLDLVPAQVVDNMVISKTATPDMSGDFAGGLIQINTKDIPDENTFYVNLGAGMHSLTTFKEFNKSPESGGTDFIGIENGSRQLPASISESKIATSRDIFTNKNELIAETNLFKNDFRPKVGNALPNFSLQVGGSNRSKLLGNDFGFVAAVTLNNSNVFEPYARNNPIGVDSINRQKYARTDSTFGQFYDYNRYRNAINSGYLINLSYKIGQNNKFFFKNLLTYNTNDQAILRIGRIYNPGLPLPYALDRDVAYFYQSNRSFFSQLGGEHLLSESSKVKINWVAAFTNLDMITPDFKRTYSRGEGVTRFSADTSTTSRFLNGVPFSPGSPNNPGRYFFNLDETGVSLNFDVSYYLQPIRTTFKIGFMGQARDRIFTGRNFNFTSGSAANINTDYQTAFLPRNISDSTFWQVETTQRQDKYGASSMLNAAFIMAETKLLPELRAIYGLRLESYNQKVSSGFGSLTSIDGDNFKKIVDTTWRDFLPSANIIYSPNEKINIRLAYSRTLSRPEFREFAPLSFFDFTRNAIFVGNDSLTRALINNLDLKFEYYFKAGSFISINPFAKFFVNPIENLIVPSQGLAQVTYVNANSATNFGIELDARYTFDDGGLKGLTAFGNIAIITSNVDQENLRKRGLINNSVSSRPLQGQSPYVFNLGLQYQTPNDWTFTVATNTYGKRIVFVAPQDEFLVYESPRWIIDGSIAKTINRFNAKLTLGDILSQNIIYYYDFKKNGAYDEGSDEVFENYKRGYTVSFSLGYSF